MPRVTYPDLYPQKALWLRPMTSSSICWTSAEAAQTRLKAPCDNLLQTSKKATFPRVWTILKRTKTEGFRGCTTNSRCMRYFFLDRLCQCPRSFHRLEPHSARLGKIFLRSAMEWPIEHYIKIPRFSYTPPKTKLKH